MRVFAQSGAGDSGGSGAYVENRKMSLVEGELGWGNTPQAQGAIHEKAKSRSRSVDIKK